MTSGSGGFISFAPTPLYAAVFLGELVGIGMGFLIGILPQPNDTTTLVSGVGLIAALVTTTHIIAKIVSEFGVEVGDEIHHHHHHDRPFQPHTFQPNDSSGTERDLDDEEQDN